MQPSRYQFSLNARTANIALVVCLAAFVGYLSPSQQDLQPPSTHASLFSAQLLESSPLHDRVYGRAAAVNTDDGAPAQDNASSYYSFGRWRAPVENVTFHTDAQSGVASWRANTFQTKMWHYSSFNTRDYFIGMAIVKVSEQVHFSYGIHSELEALICAGWRH